MSVYLPPAFVQTMAVMLDSNGRYVSRRSSFEQYLASLPAAPSFVSFMALNYGLLLAFVVLIVTIAAEGIAFVA